MCNEQHTLQQLWGSLPKPRQHQVMVVIGRMIQRRLCTASPQQRQGPQDVLDKNERRGDADPSGQDGAAQGRVQALVADRIGLDGTSREHHAT